MMDTPIVYVGVESQDSAGGGQLFKDLKFWVALRVPMRSILLSYINQNGGIVVPREADANYLIADHVRKDVPPGSISWKFIEDSVTKGSLQDPKEYRIGPPVGEARPVASRQTTKAKRTPYTSDDDAYLIRWVLARRSNSYSSGNEMYMRLEKMNNRHTWQSWRDRWLKRFSALPDKDLLQLSGLDRLPDPLPADQQSPQSRRSSGRHQTPQAGGVETTTTPPQDTSDSNDSGTSHAPRCDRPPATDDEPRETPITRRDGQNEEEKAQFLADLTEYFSTIGNDKPDLNPKVFGQTVDLFRLHQVVKQFSREVNWSIVAMELGFDLKKLPNSPDQLRKCYDITLRDFVIALDGFEESDDSDGDELVGEEIDVDRSERHASLSNVAYKDVAPVDASSPLSQAGGAGDSPPSGVRAGSKRTIEADAAHGPSSNPPKRQRRPRRDEIPSTPDEKLRIRRSPILGNNLSSPSRRVQSVRVRLEESRRLEVQSPGETNIERETRVLVATTNKAEEDVPNLQETEQWDTTPSQQLRHEENLSSPVPFRLAPSKHNNRTGNNGKAEDKDNGKRPADSPSGMPGSMGDAYRVSTSRATPSGHEIIEWSADVARAQAQDQNYAQKQQLLLPKEEEETGDGPLPPSDDPGSDDCAELMAAIERFEAVGYERKDVVTALAATTLKPGLAGQVMEILRGKHRLPENVQGVWTSRDDEALRLIDDATGASPGSSGHRTGRNDGAHLDRRVRRELKRLKKKHGAAEIEARRQFLAYRDELSHIMTG